MNRAIPHLCPALSADRERAERHSIAHAVQNWEEAAKTSPIVKIESHGQRKCPHCGVDFRELIEQLQIEDARRNG